MAGSMTAAAVYAATVSPASNGSSSPPHSKEKVHHAANGKGFINPWESAKGPAIVSAMLKARITGEFGTPDTTPPTVTVRKPQFLPSRETGVLRATWLGHAAYLVEFPSGLRVLFDPVFSERCSPFSWLGPKRYTEVPCQIDDIPIVDAVIISHSHYDHLDLPTIKNILIKHPKVHFFVPLKNKEWFTAQNIDPKQVTELDWWEESEMKLVPTKEGPEVLPSGEKGAGASSQEILATIGCLPCQHSSGRTLFDKACTLWASWSVESGGKKVYFGGDTGYRSVPKLPKGTDDYGEGHDYPHCPAFKEIGDLRGPFDLGLLPIGAYSPRFLFSNVHANPFDSVNIFKDIKCRRAMGIHWGTWVLTDEDVLEPPRLLKEALRRSDLPETGVFDVCEIGESREFP